MADTATRTARTETSVYDRAIQGIERTIVEMNGLLGLSGEHRITFGYIGNYGPGTRGDQRIWSIFLPHPGRVGTYDDRIGDFATGDADGARAAWTQLVGALTVARWQATGSHARAADLPWPTVGVVTHGHS